MATAPRLVYLGAIAAVFAAAGCGVLSGLDDFDLSSSAASTGIGSGGGAGATSTSSSGGQGAGGGSGPEDCLDGTDNDGDDAVDCADTECNAGFECAAVPEPGWSDLQRVQRVSYPATNAPDPCADGSQPAIVYAGPAGAAQCAACACSWMGASCTAPEVSCYAGVTNCTLGVDLMHQGTACVANPSIPASGGGSCQLTADAEVVSAGTCSSSGGELTNPLTWTEEIRICSASATVGGGCDQGQRCVPKALPGFDGGVCISQDGNGACPAGWSAMEMLAYTGGDDTRGCTACGCDLASVSCAGGMYTAHDGDGCMDLVDPGINITSNACVDVSLLMDFDTFSLMPVPGTPTAGACVQSSPTGAVTPTGDTKICCSEPAPSP